MKDKFLQILNDYNHNYKPRVDSNSTLHNVLVRELPRAIEGFINKKEFIVKGSMGQGNRTFYPWISILNSKITTSTQEGIYLVYLFKRDMTGFYLALGQGMSYFEKKYRKLKYKYAKKVADYYKQELQNEESSRDFSFEPITLASKKNDIGYGYEKTVILSKYYEIGAINDDELKSDLSKMLAIYEDIYLHMGISSYANIIDSILYEYNEVFIEVDRAIKILNETNELRDYLPRNLDLSLVEVKPYSEKSKKFKKFNQLSRRKIDYVQKAKDDVATGLLGEKLLLEYERTRLKSIGLEGYEVKWVSRDSDAFGYDFLSYDIDKNNNVHEIYIEAKTTNSIVDIDFYVTRNELEASNRYDTNYYVYRLFDCKSIQPKFYRAQGKITTNFDLDPATYIASYKWKVQ